MIHADNKSNALECFILSSVRRRQCDSPMSVVEKFSFMSVNSSIGWLGVAASPLCAFYESHLQQRMSYHTVNALRSQSNYLLLLKKLGILIRYPAPPKNEYSSDFRTRLLRCWTTEGSWLVIVLCWTACRSFCSKLALLHARFDELRTKTTRQICWCFRNTGCIWSYRWRQITGAHSVNFIRRFETTDECTGFQRPIFVLINPKKLYWQVDLCGCERYSIRVRNWQCRRDNLDPRQGKPSGPGTKPTLRLRKP